MTLADLLALQDHDTLIDQARHRRAHLPEAARAAELTAAHDALVARRATVAGTQADLAGRQDAIERDVTASRAKQAELAKRLSATSVPREAQTLQSELDTARQRQRELEDAELELMEQLEPVEAELVSLDERLAAAVPELDEARHALAERAAAVDAEIAALVAARAPLAGAVGDDLAGYDAKRAKLGGVAVARLVSGSCSGCNLRLSSGELERVRQLPADEATECEQCGRLLVR
jgi:hypothetical protein